MYSKLLDRICSATKQGNSLENTRDRSRYRQQTALAEYFKRRRSPNISWTKAVVGMHYTVHSIIYIDKKMYKPFWLVHLLFRWFGLLGRFRLFWLSRFLLFSIKLFFIKVFSIGVLGNKLLENYITVGHQIHQRNVTKQGKYRHLNSDQH